MANWNQGWHSTPHHFLTSGGCNSCYIMQNTNLWWKLQLYNVSNNHKLRPYVCIILHQKEKMQVPWLRLCQKHQQPVGKVSNWRKAANCLRISYNVVSYGWKCLINCSLHFVVSLFDIIALFFSICQSVSRHEW